MKIIKTEIQSYCFVACYCIEKKEPNLILETELQYGVIFSYFSDSKMCTDQTLSLLLDGLPLV